MTEHDEKGPWWKVQVKRVGLRFLWDRVFLEQVLYE